MSGKKVVLNIEVREKGEAGAGEFVATVPQFEIQAEGTSATGAAAKAVSELKKLALKRLDSEVSEQESLPLGKKAEKKLKAVEDEEEKS